MSLTDKAVWTIERNLSGPLNLDRIAEATGASKFHLARAFGAATGRSVMTYVRERRLSNAAAALADGAPDIITLAFDAGYGSHEAFSRAFKALFDVTPETVRKTRSTEGLVMAKSMKPKLANGTVKKPRLVDGKPMLVIGLSERQSFGTQQNIPGQWGRFMARYHDVSNKTAEVPISVSTNLDDEGNFDYLCGIEVSRLSELPSGLIGLKIPAQKYAVFEHAEHAAKIGATYEAIWNKWLPESGLRPANAAVIERHMPTFNPQTGLGGVEIWIPLG